LTKLLVFGHKFQLSLKLENSREINTKSDHEKSNLRLYFWNKQMDFSFHP